MKRPLQKTGKGTLVTCTGAATVETGVKEPIQHVLEMILTRQVMS